MNIEYTFMAGGHYSIYTKPITAPRLSTTARMLERDLSVRPSFCYPHVQQLHVFSSVDPFPPVLSLTNLCQKFPFLRDLTTDTMFELPTSPSMISSRLQALTISRTTTPAFRPLFDYFPQIKSLSIESLPNLQQWLNADRRAIPSIQSLKFVIFQDLSIEDLSTFIQTFPNLNDFSLTIRYNVSQSPRDIQPYVIFEQILSKIPRIRYIETTFDIKHDPVVPWIWKNHLKSFAVEPTAFSDGNLFRLKIWF